MAELSEPLEAELSHADDRVRLNHWIPQQWGVVPHLRIGKRWFNLLWLIPIGITCLAIGIPVAQEVMQLPVVKHFLARYPGQTAEPVLYSGFPLWLRLEHFFNLFLIFLIIRAGIQILADHPRLYWNRDCTPGTEWFRFQRDVPMDRIWTAKDDSVTLPGWLGIPGVRHSIGLARWWHFSCDLLWVLNGAAFYAMLFATHQWQRLVPRSWAIFPNSLSVAVEYLSLRFPLNEAWIRYNSLQQLTYFVTVFVAAPLAIITGLMQGPAISNSVGRFGKILHRQAARSIHFLVACWFVFFIFVHVSLIFITGLRQNLNNMFGGVNDNGNRGFVIFGIAFVIVAVTWAVATPLTLKYARWVQKTGRYMVGWLKGVSERVNPSLELTEADISPFFWPNGTMPHSAEFEALVHDHFNSYKLRIDGLVANPKILTFDEIKRMPKQEQITAHFCIQGWSGVAKWGGVPMRYILDLVKPKPAARYAVFYSFAEGSEGGRYYDVHEMQNMRHHLTILAYEMNGAPVSVLHGAPLRLRCENELGFKQVKWIAAIEFVEDFRQLGDGQGGYNEDHEFYGYRMPI
ncbi:MAG TPA: molybdopterin-dependent oxidoreductase [Candidatus Binataceae bacterium]|nr:molybdopterin-dependent oxidoreductase [Candidatus Binataceae bacterium]